MPQVKRVELNEEEKTDHYLYIKIGKKWWKKIKPPSFSDRVHFGNPTWQYLHLTYNRIFDYFLFKYFLKSFLNKHNILVNDNAFEGQDESGENI